MKKITRFIIWIVSFLFLCLAVYSILNLISKSQDRKTVNTSLVSATKLLDQKNVLRSVTANNIASTKNASNDLKKQYIEGTQKLDSLKIQYPASKQTPKIKDAIKLAESDLAGLKEKLDTIQNEIQRGERNTQSLDQEIAQTEQEKKNLELELEKIRIDYKKALLAFIGSLLASLITAGTNIVVAVIGKKKQTAPSV